MVPNATARKITRLIRPLGFAAAPELNTVQGFELPLLALTEQHTRELSIAIRLQVSPDRERRWTEAHAYSIRDLIEYAQHVRRAAHVVISNSLKEGATVKILVAEEALIEAVTTVTADKTAHAPTDELCRWKAEANDLFDW